jgi:hypothetical protein
MLWRKAWRETRWRFLIGLGLLLCSAAATVFTYPQVQKLLPLLSKDVPGELGRRIRESVELARSYRGFVWANWYRQNSSQMVTLFAALLGTAGVLSRSAGSLFTLSLPVSRERLLGVRAAAGLAELFALAFVPSLVIPLLSPSIGESYEVSRALIHGLCLFAAAAVFFSLAFLLSTMFSDPWRPLLIALGIALAIALAGQLFRTPLLGVFRVMSGEEYFRGARVPWTGLLASAAVASALHYGAVRNFARRDF